jgi:pyruvate dehydrogenase E2 component (dihydrolipoamide acetyltransferase)
MNILMPQLGETVADGKITAWFKQVGDRVAPGDILFEIETEKTSMDVPATSAGYLTEIRVGAGVEAPVGTIVAVMSDSPTADAKAPEEIADLVTKAGTQPIALDPFHEVRTPERNFGRARLPGGVAITPLARRLAFEAAIDVARLASTGARGRIARSDLEALIRGGAGPADAPAANRASDGRSAEAVKALYRDRSFDEVALDGMRRTIAQRLVEAKQSIPHFYLAADVELDSMLKLRAATNAAAPKDAEGAPVFKISINDFVIKAFALALQAVATANAAWANDRILRFKRSDIGIAVAVEGGLVTPVLRDADAKSIFAISTEAKQLAQRARARQLNAQEYQGGTSVVTNLGAYGVREFAAIINPPHATVLAIGAAQRRPVETADGGFRFVSQMSVTLSCDHRIIDGSVGAELLAAFKEIVEAPARIMM